MGDSWIDEHKPYLIFGAIVVAVGLLLVKLFGANKGPTAASNAASDAGLGTTPATEYVPISTSYMTTNETSTNSGNTSAAGAPITIGPTGAGAGSPSNSGNTSTSTSTNTSTVNPPPVTPTPTTPAAPNPHAPFQKGTTFTKLLSGQLQGWGAWQDPTSGEIWFSGSSHTLGHGFQAYWLKNNGKSTLGLPVSQEYRDPSTGLVVQNFQKGTLEWNPGSNPANFDVSVLPGTSSGGAKPRKAPLLPERYHGTPGRSHTVQAGDTLHGIAQTHGKDWRTLYDANAQTLDSVAASHGLETGNPWGVLHPGTKLVIPA